MKKMFCLAQIKNTEVSYGSLAKLLHWLMAVLILALLVVGMIMTDMEKGADKYFIYGIHKATGILILFLLSIRIFWRFLNVQPFYPDNMPLSQKFAAHMLHFALYAFMLFIPLSGWLMSSAAGYGVSFYGLFDLPFIFSKDQKMAELFNDLHEAFANILIGLLVVHIGAALFHHFVKKDNILRRMLPDCKSCTKK